MYPIENSILDYIISDKDLASYNPYLKKLKAIIEEHKSLGRDELASLLISMRHDIISDYSFTIPYHDILKKVSSWSPIVEIGAGSGYWARCLYEMGADVVAYDNFPPGENNQWEWDKGNSWFDDTWYSIIQGDETSASLHPERTLLLAWPMPMNLMAYNALSCYMEAGGKTIIYIGDPDPSSSGDEHFYNLLYKQKLIESINLYSWPGIKEKMLIYSAG